MEKVLITGASGGFGVLMTEALRRAGHDVVATMRDTTTRNAANAAKLRATGAHVVELDVTNDASVERGVREAQTLVGPLSVVVHNAGVGVLGLQETFTDEDFRRLFDINVFGVQRVSRAVLPGMRERHRGLVVFVSSLLGRITLPFYGPYNASKWALEALAENYRVELSGFGVECAVLEPGGFLTPFSDNLMRPSDPARAAGYGELAKAPEGMLQGFHAMLKSMPQQDPARVADALRALLDAPHGSRPFRTPVDFIGMADAIAPYNEHLAKLTAGLYANMKLGHMLEVR